MKHLSLPHSGYKGLTNEKWALPPVTSVRHENEGVLVANITNREDTRAAKARNVPA
jgi:hypothetical protein